MSMMDDALDLYLKSPIVASGAPLTLVNMIPPKFVILLRKENQETYDVVYDFFGDGQHALLSNAGVTEFKERFGIIWLQVTNQANVNPAGYWKPIDRKQFFDYVNDIEQTYLYDTAILRHEDVLKMMADPHNE